MIDHMGIAVTDMARSVAFYTQALAPLGYAVVMQGEGFAGFGVGGKPDLWLHPGTPIKQHVALRAERRTVVNAFHQAGLAAGGTDNGAPGVRAHYHPNYFAAFVLDPDGNNLEAVCHEPYLG